MKNRPFFCVAMAFLLVGMVAVACSQNSDHAGNQPCVWKRVGCNSNAIVDEGNVCGRRRQGWWQSYMGDDMVEFGSYLDNARKGYWFSMHENGVLRSVGRYIVPEKLLDLGTDSVPDFDSYLSEGIGDSFLIGSPSSYAEADSLLCHFGARQSGYWVNFSSSGTLIDVSHK